MQESAIYQDILQKGEKRGFEGGFKSGFELGCQLGLKQGKAKLILLIMNYRFGTLPGNVSEKIRGLSISKIDKLARSQIDFSTVEDVVNWLERQG